MDILYIVMPAYNEEANIEAVVRQWYPVLEGKDNQSRIVVADSGSSDKTHEILLFLKNTSLPQLEILENTEKQHGPKVIALYNYAINKGADYIFQTDSDGQTTPSEFESFWILRKKYAGIFGNRTVRGDGRSRAFVEYIVCLLLRIIFKVKVPDANAPFRLMKAETVSKYLSKLPQNFNLPNIMMTAYFAYYGESIAFREITFRPRQGGTNSIDLKKICKIGMQAVKDFRKLKKEL